MTTADDRCAVTANLSASKYRKVRRVTHSDLIAPGHGAASTGGPGDNSVADERMNIVIGGHVDHGKSTIVGRLLADTHSLPEGKLEATGRRSASTHFAKPFEYAFLPPRRA
jgi:hypothetical protein